MGNIEFNLSLLQIGKPKEKKLIIKDINFQLDRDNRIVALIGESGVGKTTIYKSLFSTYINLWKKEHPIEFECNHKINGVVYSHNEIERGVVKPNFGFATQNPYFFNYKSVEENLFYPLRWLKGINNTKEFRDSYLNKFQLSNLKKMEMYKLSGGQRQMVNIARVFLSNPDLVIIDESLSNIDETKAKNYIQIVLSNYSETFIFLTSHRGVDIDFCGATKINLSKKNEGTINEFVTMA